MKILFNLLFILSFVLSGCSGNDNENIIEASGNIEATYVTVSSRSSGEILKLLKDEGDLVKEDDTVMIIDHETAVIQLKQAVAVVRIA